MKNVSPHAISGAPFSADANTTSTPENVLKMSSVIEAASIAQSICVRPSRFRSGSLNHAVLTFGPLWAMPPSIFRPGTSYSSKRMPFALSRATSDSMSVTSHDICVCPPRFVAAGIDEEPRGARPVHDAAVRVPLDRETEGLSVEPLGLGDVGDRNRRISVVVFQHWALG